MKQFSISVKITAEEHYIVRAGTFEEAIEEIKNGDAYLTPNEGERDIKFYLEREEEI